MLHGLREISCVACLSAGPAQTWQLGQYRASRYPTTARLAFRAPELNAVVPPRVAILAMPPAVPVVWSQAR
jgi:hypothetical protein